MSVRYEQSGPLLDGAADRVVENRLKGMEAEAADEGVRRIRQRLGQVLKHPTGYYSSRVVKTMRSDGYDVTDSRVVYGGWLEGVSSRNTRSRFKGYHTFREIGQKLDADVEHVVQPITNQMVKELGGGN